MTIEEIKNVFFNYFGSHSKQVYFCPGRVNLIGEHIDYNGGFVMPFAISMGTFLLIAPNSLGRFRIKSLNFEQSLDIKLKDSYYNSGTEWFNHPLGIINQILSDHKVLAGADLLFYGNLPIGAGLSSSASIQIVSAFALNDMFQLAYDKLDIIKLAKSVENNFIGVNSGIMDQYAVSYSEKDKVLLINCKELSYVTVPALLDKYRIAIVNTNKPRTLDNSKYNERVSECEMALKIFQQKIVAQYLCDIEKETLTRYKYLFKDETLLKRATHVIEENERVKLGAEYLRNGKLIEFGKLMNQSHYSLKHLYEVSVDELDTIVDYSQHYLGVIGARMTGAGFGGCAIALIEACSFDDYSKDIAGYYRMKFGYCPTIYISSMRNGVEFLPLI